MNDIKYRFAFIPDLSNHPYTYCIYKDGEKENPVAIVFFNGSYDYEIKGKPNLSLTEQLKLTQACSEFSRVKFFTDWD